MKRMVHVPKPPPGSYRELQKELGEILGRNTEKMTWAAKAGLQRQKDLLTESLLEKFMEQFLVRRTEARAAYDIAEAIQKLCPGMIDHKTLWRYCHHFVVVTQPYHPMKTEHFERLWDQECEIVDLNDWGWYFPGRATCYAYVVSKRAQLLLTMEVTEPVAHMIFS